MMMMRTALVIALFGTLTSLAAGCGLPLGCGGYSGGNDRVLARDKDTMILCENGGFVVDLASSTMAGRYETDAADSDITHATLTDTASVAFTLTEQTDGTSTAPELGSGTWSDVTLDQVGLDHANTQCVNLQSLTWWSANQ